MIKTKNPLKTIIFAVSAFFLIIIGISVYFIIQDAKKTSSIEIFVAPVSAEITLNHQKFENMQTHRLGPGDYHLTVSKPDYFETYEADFTINPGETKEIYLELTALPDTDWYKDYPDDARSMDAIINHELTKKSEDLANNYPLLTVLPLKVEYYKNNTTYVYYLISYEIDEKNQPTILVKDYTGDNYESALEKIKSEGFNPEDYNIEYQDKTSEIAPAFSPE